MLAVIGMAQYAHGQYNDFGLWMSVNAEKKLTPKWGLTLSEEVRLNEDFSEIGTFYTEAGAYYKIFKWFQIAADYRFVNKHIIDNIYSIRHVWFVDIEFKKKLKPLTFQMRSRCEGEYHQTKTEDKDEIPEYYSREKLTIKYELNKKVILYLYTEAFIPINYKSEILIDKVKYCAGVEYKFNRVHSAEVYYLIQQEYNVKYPLTDFVIGITYNLRF